MINVWGVTDVGCVRKQNQDRYYIAQYGSQLVASVVCDGMGGARAGHIASQIAVEVFSEHMKALEKEMQTTPTLLLRECGERANTEIFNQAKRCEDYYGMGTTMVSVILHGTVAHIMNIGDSRAYHISDEGIARVTRDHSLVEALVANGKITPEEACNHPQKNLITRALGSGPTVEPDLYEKELKAGEFLLLCSDGLSNMVNDQEILYEIVHGGSVESCCRRLLDITLSRGATDNVTIVLIQNKEGGL